ncbi:MAG TPA: D-alanyl-D-alanine carboxypeptidase/D-alanyl-D-alanine-endopeptidase [Burkholderiaceae bacterium]|jgi:D-alanyl-D-alanine carboxypeptidase/D-alanyl-D-alanine-endopeptidase (penicillin-binding protein 4)|nr:D-alanyl-D-alanine carboxypeptidase/D-alanyl-D-alanine-endopeptidase [Burkholderiaceae bacterium]
MTAPIRARLIAVAIASSCIAWIAPGVAPCAESEAPHGEIPPAVSAALHEARIPSSAVALMVAPLDGGPIRLAMNESVAMNPASTMKLLTTYAALNLLGPAFQWRTGVYATSRPRGGRLDGDLVLRGSGDPSLVIERFWMLVHRLRGLGLRQIHGNLVLDKSAFEADVASSSSLDGNDLRPYNVAPDALLVNFKTLSLDFVPDPAASVARIIGTPTLAGMRLPGTVPLVHGACGDWRERLKADFSDPWAPRFTGHYSLECAEQTWHVSLLDHTHFVGAAFRALWEAAGGSWSGHVLEGRTPTGAVELLVHESPPLSEIVRDINKFSNNVMARQVFLTLGAPDPGPGASPERSTQAVTAWLAQTGLPMPELVLENGCGLSRRERISADSLARLLRHAYAGPRMPEFVASLPVAGLDGTMKKRNAAPGNAYVKTGLLEGVRALAGYVLSASGHRYVVVAIVNHANADAATGALDALLSWVQERG